MSREFSANGIEIESDGRVVWVNDPTGCCIGRFSKNGVDVHRTGPEQVELGTQCLDCFHEGNPAEQWDRFVSSMKTHHGVDVSARHRPKFVGGIGS